MTKINTEKIIAQLKNIAQEFKHTADVHNIGYVLSSADGIAQISGLNEIKYGEYVFFPKQNVYGIVQDILETHINVAVLSTESISAGAHVIGTGKVPHIAVSEQLLGRVVDIFGNSLDDNKIQIDASVTNASMTSMPLEADAPSVFDREPVTESLATGIKTIDAFLPIGRGQREMIIGDRSTGKTSIALDMIINQKYTHSTKDPVFCIYVAIGQKASNIAHIKQILEENDAMKYTVIVAATASDPAIMQVLAPYAGCAVGEYFRNKGQHALVVYDDLTRHAIAHRHISLLLRRPPGREAYPGDTFYLHSRLLERAAKMSKAKGGGSLTAIPIITIQDGNYAAYVPTNVWSITDGQIVLNTKQFLSGQRPAIDIGLSVSRVGSAAQIQAMKPSMKLKLLLAQYDEYKTFAKYGSELDQSTLMILNSGRNLVELLKQRNHNVCSMPEEVVLFQASLKGFLNTLDVKQIQQFQEDVRNALLGSYNFVASHLYKHGTITPEIDEKILDLLQQVLSKY